jgi:hypothetical protein
MQLHNRQGTAVLNLPVYFERVLAESGGENRFSG